MPHGFRQLAILLNIKESILDHISAKLRKSELHCNFSSSAELHRVRTEGKACAALHPEKQVPVQDLVVCYVATL